MHGFLANLTTGEKIAIWAIGVPAILAILAMAWRVWEHYTPKPSEREVREIKQRVYKVEQQLTRLIPAAKTIGDAQEPLTSKEKENYDQLVTELRKQQRQLRERFNQEIEMSLDAQLSYATALTRQAKYREAEQACRAIIAGHPDNTDVIIVLGVALCESAKYDEAGKLFEKALAKDVASYGKDHPNVARDLNNLASLLQDRNRPKEAEPLVRRALEIHEKTLGPDHPNTVLMRNNLKKLVKE